MSPVKQTLWKSPAPGDRELSQRPMEHHFRWGKKGARKPGGDATWTAEGGGGALTKISLAVVMVLGITSERKALASPSPPGWAPVAQVPAAARESAGEPNYW